VLALSSILLTFALTTADGVRDAVAYQIGREKCDARAVWGTALRVIAVTAPIGVGILLLIWRFSNGQQAYLYAALAFPFAMYVQAVGIVYLLRDRVERINIQNASTIGGGGSLLTLALVLIFHAPLWVVLTAWVVTYVAAAIWATTGVPDLLGRGPIGERAGLLREQVVFASKVSLTSNVTLLALRVDVFIVTAMLSPALLGIYTLALATAEVMWNLSRAVLWSSVGKIATLDFQESAELCARIVRSIVGLQFCAGIVLFAFGPWLIDLVYGTRFNESGNVMRLLLPGVIFYSADGMLSYFISVKSARPGLLLGMECATLVLTAAITFLSISRLGIYAGALAHTISYLVSYSVKVAIFVRLSGIRPLDVLLPRPADLPGAFRLRSAGGKA
jgi:O-antigen/teichoic acid export membrane protein